jgi:polysaccharide chain length determinant protein (PEP-CTERM system associated)
LRSYNPKDLVHILSQRRWMMVVPFAVGLLAVPLLSQVVPEKFRSETLITVVPQRVPDSYVKATITETIADRLPSISEQILSRSRLERIIVDLNLYPERRARQVMEDVVQVMRSDVTVNLVGGQPNADSFRVSYVSDHADTARKVTEQLASLYIDQNLQDREKQAESTSQFLETELQTAKERLIDHEKKLEAYRKAHAGELPSQLQGNLQSIQNANLQLQALNESMNRASEKRLLIERQIADAQTTPAPEVVLQSGTETAVSLPSTAEEQLLQARGRLSSLLQIYTPNHPTVITAQRLVDELQGRVDRGESLTSSAGGAPNKPVLTAFEAAKRKKLQELNAELLVIEKQLESNRSEQATLKSQIGALQSKVDVLPSRESELVELTRDYSTLQASYASLLTKREDSAMAASLEKRQIGEQFRVIDPASFPEKPYNLLTRVGIMGAGPALGLLAGLLAIAFLELRDSSFRSEEEVAAALSLPVLALIPLMQSEREQRMLRARERWMDISSVGLLVAAVIVVVSWGLLL